MTSFLAEQSLFRSLRWLALLSSMNILFFFAAIVQSRNYLCFCKTKRFSRGGLRNSPFHGRGWIFSGTKHYVLTMFYQYTFITNSWDTFFLHVSNYNFVFIDSTNSTEYGHGANGANAGTPRTTPPLKSTGVLPWPWPKTHENSKTSKPKQSSNLCFTSRRSHGSANDRTWTTSLHSPRAKPTVYSTACKYELVKCHVHVKT